MVTTVLDRPSARRVTRPTYWRTFRARHRTTSLAGDAVHRDGCPVIARELGAIPWRQMDGQHENAVRVLTAIDPLLDLCAVCFGAPNAIPGERMSSDLVAIKPGQAGAPPATIDDRIAYAKELADNGLLPRIYQRAPGNVLVAMEKAAALRIPTMAAIEEYDVINGKARPNGKLLAYFVRRAGHKMRVYPITGDGDQLTARCDIIRADDPDFVYTATFSIADAKTAKLLDKDGPWKTRPRVMLNWRAQSECVSMACPEVVIDAPAGLNLGHMAGSTFVDAPIEPPVAGLTADEDDVADAELVPEPEHLQAPEGNRDLGVLRKKIWAHGERLYPTLDNADRQSEIEIEFAQLFDGVAFRDGSPEQLDVFEQDLAARVAQ